MLSDGINKKTNRLINEKSPYLLQHAYNPVDWYGWSEEAFQKARTEDKPIFLSIGYSTCHWCHVMAHESFEDEEVANVLNNYFICIKVDREERPDIDSVYMSVCQAMTGSGGWPLNLFLTKDKKPFYAGTYFPKTSKYNQTGFIEILESINNVWVSNKDHVLTTADQVVKTLNGDTYDESSNISKDILNEGFQSFLNSFDAVFGGFSKAPKFPSPHNLSYLLSYYKDTREKRALEMVEITLKSMYKGGIFDHIGFGFSRYSVDEKWLVPHFEKMLYDNALLAIAYIETYEITKDNIYKEVAEKILAYILRDMTSKEGGFYCGEDADSEGVEGKFYLWDFAELYKVLNMEEANLFIKYYGIQREGNFEGRNIPNLIGEELEDLDKNGLKEKLENIRRKLFDYREKRIHPHKDDKILTSWNGLMIAAFAKAGRVFHEDKYKDASIKALEFIFSKLQRADGRLLARFREGESRYLAYLDDYAFIIWALIETYEVTKAFSYVEKALELNKQMIDLFKDKEKGGLFLYGNDSEKLILRPKDIYDGAIPSGNGVAAMNMLRLSKITGDVKLKDEAESIFKVFGDSINKIPRAHAKTLEALLYRGRGR
ncbi:thioredoxin domain-containing protein [Clostridium algidicarnis]|uniref:thioredoxin domain-containing protein n=1 Tax=Clostridium algidicarnis TaxID=37659 RepID=UPI001C0D6E9B|nr:thioredoxin domain-containing protein [Clostridium algidicarnis]MBU3204073.1 thioredoxin domain-containing protein [Clostridium algidicarnis]MBU3212227.1 thioredoxin domain-containing protein [Clostridium algidicarnis]MBU3221268.1 thioredoxin domain-containing protein [Clostridium algidicarnis]